MTPTEPTDTLSREPAPGAGAGGVYQDGKRLAGPAPDYGWVIDAQGKRVPAPGPKE